MILTVVMCVVAVFSRHNSRATYYVVDNITDHLVSTNDTI